MEAPNWKNLVERLFKIAKDTSHYRQRVFADWAMTGATMFLWSEYGLPSAAQEEFAAAGCASCGKHERRP